MKPALIAKTKPRLNLAIGCGTSGRELIQLATTKRETAVRGRPVLMFASFCPFCGKSLEVPHG